jgi:hypothetical protein
MTQKNKIIFVDIDGPMIPIRAYYLQSQTDIVSLFDPCAVSLLNKLIEASQASIVISSTWQIQGYESCKTIFEDNGIICEFHRDWCTERKFSSTRTQEISWWLNNHPEITHYVALDDEMLDSKVLPGFVQCDTHEGFSFRNFLESKQLLDVIDDEELDLLHFLKRKELWRTQRSGDPNEHLTWEFADKLFPIKHPFEHHMFRGFAKK